MQKYLNIYLKELKVQFKAYALSIFSFMVLTGFFMFVSSGSSVRSNRPGMINTAGILLIISAILVIFFVSQILFFFKNLNEKRLSEFNYLLYSIPTRRFTPLLIKFLVFSTYLIITFGILFFWSFAVMCTEIQNMEYILRSSNFRPDQITKELLLLNNGNLFFVLHHSRFFFTVKLLAGLTFFISGVLLFIKTLRYRLKWFGAFAQTAATLAIFIIFCLFGLFDLNSQHNVVGLLTILSCIAAGIIFMVLGLSVYEKYGQI